MVWARGNAYDIAVAEQKVVAARLDNVVEIVCSGEAVVSEMVPFHIASDLVELC